MQALISPREAARRIGVSHTTIRTWLHRKQHPLPSVIVGASGRNLKVIVAEIEPWLAAEAARKAAVK